MLSVRILIYVGRMSHEDSENSSSVGNKIGNSFNVCNKKSISFIGTHMFNSQK